jgi:hypothetical protein
LIVWIILLLRSILTVDVPKKEANE